MSTGIAGALQKKTISPLLTAILFGAIYQLRFDR